MYTVSTEPTKILLAIGGGGIKWMVRRVMERVKTLSASVENQEIVLKTETSRNGKQAYYLRDNGDKCKIQSAESTENRCLRESGNGG